VNRAQRTAPIANGKTARPPWPSTRLGEVLAHRKEFIRIDDTVEYLRCRVQLHAKGIVLRDRVEGALIKTKDQQVCRAGEFLVAEIDAKVGGFGVVPPELTGSIVSSHYFLFVVDSNRLDQRFLDYYSKTPAFRDQVRAQGSTNYAAIRPSHVLGYTIPLPPLPEQRRIVAKLDQVASKLAEAQRLRNSVRASARQLLLASFHISVGGAPWRPLGEVAPLVRRPVTVSPAAEYPELGIRSFGRGTFHKPALSGTEVGGKKLFRLLPGDLIFNNVFAWEGAVAVARDEDAGRFGSHRFITCVPNPETATSPFLCFYFLTEPGLAVLSKASPGGAGRNRTLGLAALSELRVPVPSLWRQREFDLLQGTIAKLARTHDTLEHHSGPLMPAILDRAFKGEL